MKRYSSKEFAKELGIQEQTIRLWLKQGKIQPNYNDQNELYFTEEQRKEKQVNGAYAKIAPTEKTYRVQDFADALGVHEQTVRNWLQKGEIAPKYRVRKTFLFSEEQVEEWAEKLERRKKNRYIILGEFAKIVGESKTHLQLYDYLGIFIPQKKTETGSRYYKQTQISEYKKLKEEPKYQDILQGTYYGIKDLRKRYNLTNYAIGKIIIDLDMEPKYVSDTGYKFYTQAQVEQLDNYFKSVKEEPKKKINENRMNVRDFSLAIQRRKTTVRVWDYIGLLTANREGHKQIRYYTEKDIQTYYKMQEDAERRLVMQEEYYTLTEMAEKLGLTQTTLWSWSKNKQLEPKYNRKQGGVFYSETQYRKALNYVRPQDARKKGVIITDIDVAKIVGEKLVLLGIWHAEGYLKADEISDYGEKYYYHDTIKKWLQKTKLDRRKTIGYWKKPKDTPISSSYIEQLSYMHYLSKLGENYTLIVDNEERRSQQKKNLQRILEQIQQYEIAKVVIQDEQDLEPLGVSTFKNICAEFFTEIICVNKRSEL